MTAAENLRLLQSFVATYNQHDLDRLATFYKEDARVEAAGVTIFEGREANREHMAEVFRAFPDAHLEVLASAADDLRVFALWEFKATQVGALPGAGPGATGGQIRTKAVICTELRDGKIASAVEVLNAQDVARQLGWPS